MLEEYHGEFRGIRSREYVRVRVRLALDDTIYLADSFQFWPGNCFSFKTIRHK